MNVNGNAPRPRLAFAINAFHEDESRTRVIPPKGIRVLPSSFSEHAAPLSLSLCASRRSGRVASRRQVSHRHRISSGLHVRHEIPHGSRHNRADTGIYILFWICEHFCAAAPRETTRGSEQRCVVAKLQNARCQPLEGFQRRRASVNGCLAASPRWTREMVKRLSVTCGRR